MQRGQFATSPRSTGTRSQIRFSPPALLWRELGKTDRALLADNRMRTTEVSHRLSQLDLPATSELFSKVALVERHPNLLTHPRIQWALRNRATNGLAPVVYESKSGQLLIHEPEFLRWYLGLTGRSKPRATGTPTWQRAVSRPELQSHSGLASGSLSAPKATPACASRTGDTLKAAP